MANTTLPFAASDLPPLPSYTIQTLPPLLPWISDANLALALPIIAYWVVSMFFHFIDEMDFFPHYRLHTPAEVLKRNHVSRWDVFRDVVIQQIVQTIVGFALAWIDPEPTFGKEEYDIALWAQRLRGAQKVLPGLLALVGVDATGLSEKMGIEHAMLAGALSGGFYPQITQTIVQDGMAMTAPAFADWELWTAKAIYHVLIPAFQFVLAICVVDTWQYFLHRAMHMNKFLYTTFHSRHHRLYVPYAYGALYNHPFEGFLLDTLGTGVAYLASGMTVRQSMWFFTMSTIKTVDDHCGYAFPWDPLQHLTSNNAGYHDVHHQSWGIKTNFSQPFFTFWDGLLGTKWVGGDVSARYERARIAAQKKVDADASSVTASTPSESTHAPLSPYQAEASHATPSARSAQSVTEPHAPAGKAAHQALGSRQQILDDRDGGGVAVLAEESAEEMKAQRKLHQSHPSPQQQTPTQQQQSLRRSSRKRTTSSGLKGFADRMGESLHGKSSGVLGVDSRR
ncbi:C4-hydroxylase [Hortaea werneckii]|nr:C4-hydroxylase [Hortaea werneckii]